MNEYEYLQLTNTCIYVHIDIVLAKFMASFYCYYLLHSNIVAVKFVASC